MPSSRQLAGNGPARPAVTIVVPFAGSEAAADRTIAAIGRIHLREGDVFVIVDNNPRPAVLPGAGGSRVVLHAATVLSSYFARNTGASSARTPWLLFLDADCLPAPDLLDRYFDPDPGDEVGILAGAVVGAAGQESFAARYAGSRGQIEIEHHLETGPKPSGVTANLLVRRSCWEQLGGFAEVVSGADLEFCWRAQEEGWGFETRLQAIVEHEHQATVRGMAQKARRHGAGRAWINRERQGALPRPRIARPLIRGLGGSMIHALRGRREEALFKLADFRWAMATLHGYLRDDNVAERRPPSAPGDQASIETVGASR